MAVFCLHGVCAGRLDVIRHCLLVSRRRLASQALAPPVLRLPPPHPRYVLPFCYFSPRQRLDACEHDLTTSVVPLIYETRKPGRWYRKTGTVTVEDAAVEIKPAILLGIVSRCDYRRCTKSWMLHSPSRHFADWLEGKANGGLLDQVLPSRIYGAYIDPY